MGPHIAVNNYCVLQAVKTLWAASVSESYLPKVHNLRVECGGKITYTLCAHCSDAYFTNGFYYLYLGTENSATVGSHCRYAFPPQYNLTNYLIQCVSVATEITSYPEGCSQVLEMISTDDVVSSIVGTIGGTGVPGATPIHNSYALIKETYRLQVS